MGICSRFNEDEMDMGERQRGIKYSFDVSSLDDQGKHDHQKGDWGPVLHLEGE